MRISHEWLKEFVDFRLPPEKLAEGLSMLGLEVVNAEDPARTYDKFVVGEVLENAKHPNADRLTVCKVNVGKELLQIVCGAPNVAVGQKVATALVGATIPHNQHDPDGKPFVLEETPIRGVESHGMICSAYELGVGADSQGIMVLDETAKIGMPLARFLGKTDVIYEIEITANRGDWLSHLGVAREVAALVGSRVKDLRVTLREKNPPVNRMTAVKVLDRDKCKRYCARVLQDVRVEPSPAWLQERLTSVGMRPINNVVDVTNYVMLETGQPLHAFDYDLLAGHTIVVKCAHEGERFTTLDGKERVLRSDTLMICDAEKAIAIGGVMGGRNSEISSTTTSILLESAHFDPVSIRRTAKHLGLSTDASQRFERSVDIEIARHAVDRAAQLLAESSGARVLKGVIDVYPKKAKRRSITLQTSRANAVLGTRLSETRVKSLLRRLGLECRPGAGDRLVATVPTYRSDLLDEIDLIEEVARIFGYNNIETKMRGNVEFPEQRAPREFEHEIRNHLIGAGFHEVVANSLQERSPLAGTNYVEVLNPVSKDMSVLRTSLVPGILEIIAHNINHGERDLRFFELGKAYFRKQVGKKEDLAGYVEEARILIALTGRGEPIRWDSPGREIDLFDLKGEVESLFSKIFLDKIKFIYYSTTKALTDPVIGIEINKTYVGYLGRVKEEVRGGFGIKQDVFVAELDTEKLDAGEGRKFRPLPRYPVVLRDLAFVLDVGQPVEGVLEVIHQSGGELIEKADLFDVYEGENVGAGRKSCAFSIRFRSEEGTLTEAEIEKTMRHIISEVESRFRAKLRDA